jgi:zinc D-Ala-D-Ala carboxypeptidase
MKLSEHFSLAEFIATDTGLDNTPSQPQWQRLVNAATNMEWIRRALGNVPVTVSSAFRSGAVNARVGGATTSAHLDGDAVDFTVSGLTNAQIIQAVLGCGVPFDQVINENRGALHWVHISFAKALRGQVMHFDGHGYTLQQVVKWH